MNTVYLATITTEEFGTTIYQFVGTDEGRTNYLAGRCMDELHDYHGIRFAYTVVPIPYLATMTPDQEVVRAALESAV